MSIANNTRMPLAADGMEQMEPFFAQGPVSIPPLQRTRHVPSTQNDIGVNESDEESDGDGQTANYGRHATQLQSRKSSRPSNSRSELVDDDDDDDYGDDADNGELVQIDQDEQEEEEDDRPDYDDTQDLAEEDEAAETSANTSRRTVGRRSDVTSAYDEERSVDDIEEDGGGTQTMDLEGSRFRVPPDPAYSLPYLEPSQQAPISTRQIARSAPLLIRSEDPTESLGLILVSLLHEKIGPRSLQETDLRHRRNGDRRRAILSMKSSFRTISRHLIGPSDVEVMQIRQARRFQQEKGKAELCLEVTQTMNENNPTTKMKVLADLSCQQQMISIHQTIRASMTKWMKINMTELKTTTMSSNPKRRMQTIL